MAQSDAAACGDDVFDTTLPGPFVLVCIVNYYATDDEISTVLLTTWNPPITVASRGWVEITLETGQRLTTPSAALGYEDPQCSIWNLPGVASCVDSNFGDDAFYTASTPDTAADCLIFANVGINVHGDPEDEFFFPHSGAMIVPGACTNL